ncbi:MAG: TetR/AcrR family transcriptional regulator [Anaerolineae bacterium]|jgi:AcrR family transcriptional regulator|nr:TetR/AcrR family transcriptional regulator [Anaerolineae bacterium]PKO01772.1 MAG: TetR family transcriptional regulator [Chloroflexi bacterium HGW-Chloroflexi-5]
MSPRPKGRTSKSDLRERIIDAAWTQIAREGAPALSLRAIARDLGIAAPSIYNYFVDRDALVTALILEAYESLASHQNAANDAVPFQNLHARLASIGNAYRDWAVTYPQRYLLIFGTPIPGYVAPLEAVVPIAARSLSALISVVESYHLAGRLKIDDIDTQTIAVLIWTRVHGLVLVEITNNLPPISPSGSQLFEIEFRLIIDQFFME